MPFTMASIPVKKSVIELVFWVFNFTGNSYTFVREQHCKQVDVLPSKNQALCDLIYDVIISVRMHNIKMTNNTNTSVLV